jgi:hypothetical protein
MSATVLVCGRLFKENRTSGSGKSLWALGSRVATGVRENLSDQQAADAVRGRIDWNYALALELGDPRFDSTMKSAIQC